MQHAVAREMQPKGLALQRRSLFLTEMPLFEQSPYSGYTGLSKVMLQRKAGLLYPEQKNCCTARVNRAMENVCL